MWRTTGQQVVRAATIAFQVLLGVQGESALVGRAYNAGMEITVKLPDDLAKRANPGREALEALVVEGYRSGAFSHYQASQMLGLSRFAFDGFLKERNIYDHAYSAADLQDDQETLRHCESKGSTANDAGRR